MRTKNQFLQKLPYRPRRFLAVLAIIIAALLASIAFQSNLITLAAPVDVGYTSFSYGSSGASSPTGEKPESKLWYADGQWWGSLYNNSAQAYRIYRFNESNQNWQDTGVAIDDRNDSRADALWDEATQKLYIVSHVFTTSGTSSNSSSNWGRLYRYSYSSDTTLYSLDTGFPVTVTQGLCETLTIDKDSTGRLWVTYVEDREVMVNHSQTSDMDWETPYVLPVNNTSVSSDDISSIITFQGDKIAVVWSNQLVSGMFMAVHSDGAPDNQWQLETIVQGSGEADDHINLKTDSAGRLFVASKTRMWGTNPLIVLYVRSTGGVWSSHTFSTGDDGHTRPIVMIDDGQNMVYVFATSDDNSGEIFLKKSSISNISFPAGMGTPFIQDSDSPHINDPSSTKQNVTSATGMLVIASNYVNHYYYHNDALAGSTGPDPTPTINPNISPTPSNTPTITYTPSVTPTPSITPIPPAIQTYGPSHDTYVKKDWPTSNYGDLDHLRLRESSPDIDMNAFLKFDINPGGLVTSAKLRLYAYDGSDDGGSVHLVSNNYLGSTQQWTEMGLTWNNAPLLDGSPVSSVGSVGGNVYVEFDVTAAIGGSGTYSFGITSTSSNSVFYYSKESSINQPELILELDTGQSPTNTPPPTATATLLPSSTPTLFESPTVATATLLPADTDTPVWTTTDTIVPTDTFTPTETILPTDTPLPTSTWTPTPTPVPPAIQSYSPIEDSYVKKAWSTSNYGDLDHLRSRESLPDIDINTYLKFEISDPGGTVTSAILRLYAYDGSDDGGTIYLVSNNYQNSTQPWSEEALTWENAPLLEGNALSAVGSVNSNAFVNFDVTAAITGDGTYSFGITGASSNSVFYYSKESALNPPELILSVDVAVEPTATATETAVPATDIATATPSNLPPPTDTLTPEPPTATLVTTETATPLPTDTATAVESDTPIAASSTATFTETAVPATDIATATPSDSPLPTDTLTPEPPTATLVTTETATPLPTDTATAVESDTPIATNTATPSATLLPTDTPTLPPTATATPVPSATPASGSLILSPVDDTYVRLSWPDSIYGDGDSLRAREALPGDDINIYLKFDVPQIGTVTSATLRLFAYDSSNDGGSVYLVPNGYQGSTQSWAEDGLNWNNAPGIQGGPLATVGSVGKDKWVELNITSSINGAGTYSFAVSSTSSNSVFYYSKESGLNAPELVVQFQGSTQPAAPATDGETQLFPSTAQPIHSSNQLLVQSDSPALIQSGTWTTHSTSLASNGSYLYSGGTNEDSLTLGFYGTQVEIIYLTHPALGSFVVEVDGQRVQVINAGATESFGMKAAVTGLGSGSHILRIYPAGGTIAIDAFNVEGVASLPAVLPTATPQLFGSTGAATLSSTAGQPVPTTTIEPTPELPSGMTLMPTPAPQVATATPLPPPNARSSPTPVP